MSATKSSEFVWSKGWLGVLVLSLLSLVCFACATTPPPPIAAGSPGSDGPCSALPMRTITNPAEWQLPVQIFEPAGSGRPFTGGSCNDAVRPVIFFAHGYSASFTEGYSALLTHLVSNGFVVIYPGFQIAFDPPQQYRAMNAGFVIGAAVTPRADTSRSGFVGHSWGGGMTPRMMQLAAARGWGSKSMWSVLFAPSHPYEVGNAAISLPEKSRMLAVSFDQDFILDMRISSDIIKSVTLPPGRASHMLIRSDLAARPRLVADHAVPVTLGTSTDTGLDVDHLDRWAVWRPIAAIAGCELSAIWCSTDLADMGTQPDGHVVRAAQMVSPQIDAGPPALVECTGLVRLLSQRRCG
ncbi:MAG: hypothetical protein WD029_02880 [Microthrixaceae bacterium]